ncbi:hypothetical protein [Aliiroseovarius sediminis]|uniref:hypothetical protein n=1 Tax=Aliiroseovarius sediminis TaxID=2925839 RepID=UPI001F561A57|nr:hypothetical protein [Aliiroseovarius sediminis]MCI2393940.1 hypothetical protein [Aliiroseovarius sediminis]
MDDMVIRADIRDQHLLSQQSYGRPRMTEELQELGRSNFKFAVLNVEFASFILGKPVGYNPTDCSNAQRAQVFL